jgi:outer membrane protein assembly factor BamA
MKTLSFFTLVLLLLMAPASVTLAQTNAATSIRENSCIDDSLPGRPTLKRREPAPQTTDEGSVDQQMLLKEKCKQKDPAADLLSNQPIRIEFEGLHAFPEADMVKAFRERRIPLPTTQMPDYQVLAKASALIKELLEALGYFNATITVRENEDKRSVGFIVYEGQRLPLAEVRFEGNRSFSTLELTAKIGECEAGYQETHSGYDSDIFDYCTRSLLNFIRSRGYLRATFAQPTKEIDSRGIVLTLPLDEGPLYRLGKIKIEGSKAIAAEQIRTMLDLQRGDPANGEQLGKWLFENLKKTYEEMGYIQYTAEPEPEFGPANDRNEGIVDFTVIISEGRQFRIHDIKFKGDSLAEKELLSVLRIGADDVFNQRLFEESIDGLNQLGCFEWIDKDRDVDFLTNEEEGFITIVIKLSRLSGAPTSGFQASNKRQPRP